MNKLKTLIKKVDFAEQALEKRKDVLYDYLIPILNLYGIDRVAIDSVECRKAYSRNAGNERVDVIRIGYSWSCRGYRSSDDIELPAFIFDSENPLEEAKKLREKR